MNVNEQNASVNNEVKTSQHEEIGIEIRAEAVLEPNDFLALNRFLNYSKTKTSGMMNILIFALVALAVYSDIVLNGGVTVLSIVAIIVIVASYIVPAVNFRLKLKNDKTVVNHTMRYVFNESGINMLDANTTTATLYPWEMILEIYETKEYLFAILNKRQQLIIPKRALTVEDMDDLRGIIMYKLEKSYFDRRKKSER